MFRDAKVGDKVWRPVKGKPEGEWGEITEINPNEANGYPIVAFDLTFAVDGRERHRDGFSSLFWAPVALPPLPERPKRKIIKNVEFWTNIYTYGPTLLYITREMADRYAVSGRIACVKLTGSYEMEE